MELGACKWHRCTCIAKAPQLICNLTQLSYIKVMTWPSPEVKFWNWPFNFKRYIFWTLSTSATRWCLFYFRISVIKKVIHGKPTPCQKYFFLWWPLESKVLTLGQIWSKNFTGAWRELSSAFFRILPSYHTFGDNSECLRKTAIFFRNLTFGDLWWPQYWPDLEMTFTNVGDHVAAYPMPFAECLYAA